MDEPSRINAIECSVNELQAQIQTVSSRVVAMETIVTDIKTTFAQIKRWVMTGVTVGGILVGVGGVGIPMFNSAATPDTKANVELAREIAKALLLERNTPQPLPQPLP